MNLSNKFIFLGLVTIFFIVIGFTMFSFASDEKDNIYQALKFIDENKFNEAVVELEEALNIVRNKADLELVNLFLCKEDPKMFGIYNPRENTLYKPNDTMFLYGEPRNFSFNEYPKGLFQCHFKAEFYLLDSGNNILFSDMNFLDFPLTSRIKNTEIFISAGFPVSALSTTPGNYKIRLVLRDLLSQKSAEAIVDFTIVE